MQCFYARRGAAGTARNGKGSPLELGMKTAAPEDVAEFVLIDRWSRWSAISRGAAGRWSNTGEDLQWVDGLADGDPDQAVPHPIHQALLLALFAFAVAVAFFYAIAWHSQVHAALCLQPTRLF